ncbi:hypothetical protein WUBG_05731 [Wuchereria bancrofti]|uniref:Uncharacterized protein n=1 Tax=Wuchereria bancrofti TaxID=6293 RepID=J9ELI6_WUCBA|nr:hypothetical protein WUBG_05731 [Wuchereria bancrofti]VDM19617.1 unnamed protein product [Wuchereria bancrofti]
MGGQILVMDSCTSFIRSLCSAPIRSTKYWMCTSCGSLSCLHVRMLTVCREGYTVQMDEWLLCVHIARALLCSDEFLATTSFSVCFKVNSIVSLMSPKVQREMGIKRINQCNLEFDMATNNSILGSQHQ